MSDQPLGAPQPPVYQTVPVIHNLQLARSTFLIRLRRGTPQAIRPGQFVMLRLPGRTDPLLGRPFALYDTVLDDHGERFAFDVVYLVVGKMTGLLATPAAATGWKYGPPGQWLSGV